MPAPRRFVSRPQGRAERLRRYSRAHRVGEESVAGGVARGPTGPRPRLPRTPNSFDLDPFWPGRVRWLLKAGVTQLVECQLPKLNVVGSSPIARSNLSLWESVGYGSQA